MRWVFLLVVMVSSLYGWYADGGLQLSPVYIVLNDSENTTYGYGVYSIEGRGRIFLSSLHFVDMIIKDTLLIGTNVSNMWELRRFLWNSESEYQKDAFFWALSVGRHQFQLDEGKMFQSLGDGIGVRLGYKSLRGEATLSYAGFTEPIDTNRLYATRTHERVKGGVNITFPLLAFSLVKTGIATSVDLRTNNRTTVVAFSGGLQGSVGSWLNYTLQGWYETGEVTLTNENRSDPLAAWATEISLMMGKKDFPWQGKARLLIASGEGDLSGWNRFVSLGVIEGPAVLLHPIANLSMFQSRLTWRPVKEMFSLSLVYNLLWRIEKKDITLISLYGDGNFLGQEVALQMTSRLDPSIALFAHTGILLKGDAFAINREKPLYQVTVGMNISL